MGMNKEYERRMKEEQEIHEQVKSELEEYNRRRRKRFRRIPRRINERTVYNSRGILEWKH